MNQTTIPPHVAERLTTWLEDAAGTGASDYLDDVLESLETVRQRAAWSSPWRWLPMQMTFPRIVALRVVPIVLLIGLLVLALVVALLLAGSQRRLPPPFGLAAAGDLVLDTGGDLVRIDPKGQGSTPLATLPDWQVGATWSRDGERVAYWSGGTPDADTRVASARLWIAAADGTDARPILGDRTFTVGARDPAVSWSPDSRSMAFSTSDGALYVVDADGTDLRRIGDDTVGRCCPSWSPDGDWLAFDAGPASGVSSPGGQEDVRVIRPDGSDETQVSRGQVSLPHVDWSPDGRLVYTVDPGDVVVAERTGEGWTETPVAKALTVPAIANFFPKWSSAGDRIAYVRASALWIVDADAGDLRRMTGPDWVNLASPCWSPDDTTIAAFHAEPDGFVELQPGASALLYDVPSGKQIAKVPVPRIAGILACSWQRRAVP
jgi:Tol biopolymer transport system component